MMFWEGNNLILLPLRANVEVHKKFREVWQHLLNATFLIAEILLDGGI